MDDIIISGTLETPTIEFIFSRGELLIKGRSIPENAVAFYEPVIEGLEKYNNSPKPITSVDFELEYFNTSSSKCILDILRLLQKIHEGNSNVSINWHYEEEDEEILEIGQDFSHMVNLPFNLKLISSN